MKKVNWKELEWMICRRPHTPKGRSGKIKLTVETMPPFQVLPMVSMRNALLMGQSSANASFKEPLEIRHLHEKEHGEWMSDSPQEVWQMRDPVFRAKGTVLVGGLGLGVVSHLIAQREVGPVITVERNPSVINLVKTHVLSLTVCADLFTYLGECHPNAFDFGFFDIWQSTGEASWVQYVVPLRRLARGKIRRVMCWNEKEMKGQLYRVLPEVAAIDPDHVPFNGFQGYYDVFRQVAQRRKIISPVNPDNHNGLNTAILKAWQEAAENKELAELINLYLRPGTAAWERTFGDLWDKAYEGVDLYD